METFLAICALLSPIGWFYLGHYFGIKWSKKHPEKEYIEFWFEVEKKEQKDDY